MVVEEEADILSEEEKTILKQHLIQPTVLKEDKMLQNYVIVKSYVKSHV